MCTPVPKVAYSISKLEYYLLLKLQFPSFLPFESSHAALDILAACVHCTVRHFETETPAIDKQLSKKSLRMRTSQKGKR